ncbi:MAG: iron-containing redox enzyme family protein [Rickettsiales bacterium]
MKLDDFLKDWDKEYNKQVLAIPLFNSELTSQWNSKQKTMFAHVFYHARGHFHDFLWYVGSHADDKETKDIVLKNISEEFNGSAKSHEQLYIDFASSIGADTRNSLIDDSYYMPFAKEFNYNHMKWLHEHSNDHRFSALSAYEKLDNIDYNNLLNLVKSINVERKGQIFFKIHSIVEHFAPTYSKLNTIWETSEDTVKDSFNFIGDNQLKMWNNLSETIFNMQKNEFNRPVA